MCEGEDDGKQSNKYAIFTKLEQYASSVISYTSKYSNRMSIAYGPENLIGKNVVYPNYGDYPDTYSLRSYGKWWSESEAAQKHYMTQDVDTIISEDFVTLSFENPVLPTKIIIYETYNPGAVVRIWGGYAKEYWKLLYEGQPQCCLPVARKFSPPLKEINDLINEVRLDFNQSLLKYHTSIDGVLLIGYLPSTNLQKQLVKNGFLSKLSQIEKNIQNEETGIINKMENYVSQLPYEVIAHIFGYLDLRSLCHCAQVCKRWYEVTLDPTIYRDLSLKKYWNKVNDDVIQFFMKRCHNMKKLDLSWCGEDNFISEKVLIQFLENCCKHLTHLSVCNCEAVGGKSVQIISTLQDLTDLRLRNVTVNLRPMGKLGSGKITKLVALDLYGSSMLDTHLVEVLKYNPNLKHLILDFCLHLDNLDMIAEAVAQYNKQLVTWSSWKTNTTLTSFGVKQLAKCQNLRELDVGWCLLISDPADCLEKIAYNCKDLKRLILSQWRSVTDHLLAPILENCKNLQQLDLLGLMNITAESCETALITLPNLQLLDIGYCSVYSEQVTVWREQYPNVSIQFCC